MSSHDSDPRPLLLGGPALGLRLIVLAAMAAGLMLLVLLPVGLVAEQPDLGTALLVAASGMIVLVMGGISPFYVAGGVALIGAAVPVAWHFMTAIVTDHPACRPRIRSVTRRCSRRRRPGRPDR